MSGLRAADSSRSEKKYLVRGLYYVKKITPLNHCFSQYVRNLSKLFYPKKNIMDKILFIKGVKLD